MSASTLEVAPAASLAVTWCVLQTLPRREKKLAAWLAAHSICHYLPLRRRLHSYPSKTVAFDSPLFPGYVFASFEAPTRQVILRSNVVTRVLPAPDPDLLLSNLTQIQLAEKRGAPLDPCAFISAGQRVRVHSGRWKGIEGTVIRSGATARVVLAVEFLQIAATFEIDGGLLDPAC